jgi:hypothetical protein
MHARRLFRSVSITLILTLLLSGCVANPPGASEQGTPGASVYYKLPLLSIQIAYDFINKHLQVSISGEIQTPLGAFGITTGVSFVEKRFQGVRILTVQTGNKKFVYKLDQGRPYSINIPSDENGNTQIIYSGGDENLSIVIPNPTNETIAGLKEKLKAEQEARGLAEQQARDAESKTQSGAQSQTEQPPVESVQIPTPQPYQPLTPEQCQQRIAQYVPGQYFYAPRECQSMLDDYKRQLQQQEYEAQHRQREADYNQERQAEAARRKADADAYRRQQQIQQVGNILNNIIRRRRP